MRWELSGSDNNGTGGADHDVERRGAFARGGRGDARARSVRAHGATPEDFARSLLLRTLTRAHSSYLLGVLAVRSRVTIPSDSILIPSPLAHQALSADPSRHAIDHVIAKSRRFVRKVNRKTRRLLLLKQLSQFVVSSQAVPRRWPCSSASVSPKTQTPSSAPSSPRSSPPSPASTPTSPTRSSPSTAPSSRGAHSPSHSPRRRVHRRRHVLPRRRPHVETHGAQVDPATRVPRVSELDKRDVQTVSRMHTTRHGCAEKGGRRRRGRGVMPIITFAPATTRRRRTRRGGRESRGYVKISYVKRTSARRANRGSYRRRDQRAGYWGWYWGFWGYARVLTGVLRRGMILRRKLPAAHGLRHRRARLTRGRRIPSLRRGARGHHLHLSRDGHGLSLSSRPVLPQRGGRRR